MHVSIELNANYKTNKKKIKELKQESHRIIMKSSVYGVYVFRISTSMFSEMKRRHQFWLNKQEVHLLFSLK